MNDIPVKNGIVIPAHEIEITTSRSSGAGGQHVNRTDSRITVRWNVKNSSALTEDQRSRILENLHARLTQDGELIINNSTTRSQIQNKELALTQLALAISKALYVPKKRMKSKVPKAAKEARLESKKRHSNIKKMRGVKVSY